MKQGYVKGTDIRIIGTSDTILATANLDGFNDDGTPEYTGDTTMHWDTQETIKKGGKLVYVGDDYMDYTEDQIEFRDDEESDE